MRVITLLSLWVLSLPVEAQFLLPKKYEHAKPISTLFEIPAIKDRLNTLASQAREAGPRQPIEQVAAPIEIFYRPYTFSDIENNTTVARNLTFKGQPCNRNAPTVLRLAEHRFAVQRNPTSRFDDTCEFVHHFPSSHHAKPFISGLEEETLHAYEVLTWQGEFYHGVAPLLHSTKILVYSSDDFLTALDLHPMRFTHARQHVNTTLF